MAKSRKGSTSGLLYSKKGQKYSKVKNISSLKKLKNVYKKKGKKYQKIY